MSQPTRIQDITTRYQIRIASLAQTYEIFRNNVAKSGPQTGVVLIPSYECGGHVTLSGDAPSAEAYSCQGGVVGSISRCLQPCSTGEAASATAKDDASNNAESETTVFRDSCRVLKASLKSINDPQFAEDYLNESVIVAADSLLQGFLQEAWRAATDEELQARSVSVMIRKIDEQHPGFASVEHARDVKFLAELRHCICHDGGVVQRKDKDWFLDKVGAKEEGTDKWLWDTDIWPDKETFGKNYSLGKRLYLSITKVVIPYLAHAHEFIGEAGEFLAKHKSQA